MCGRVVEGGRIGVMPRHPGLEHRLVAVPVRALQVAATARITRAGVPVAEAQQHAPPQRIVAVLLEHRAHADAVQVRGAVHIAQPPLGVVDGVRLGDLSLLGTGAPANARSAQPAQRLRENGPHLRDLIDRRIPHNLCIDGPVLVGDSISHPSERGPFNV